MFTLIPAFYYKSRGIDFFNDVVILKKSKERDGMGECGIELKSKLSTNLIEDFYTILKSANLLDETLVGNRGEIDKQEVFSFPYIKSFVEDLFEKGESKKKLYLSTNQKITGYVLFDVLRPFIQKDVKSFYHFVYYSQKNDFKKVKYESISDSNKRGIDIKVEALLPEFLKKVRFNR
jgi:hypothetical protein